MDFLKHAPDNTLPVSSPLTREDYEYLAYLSRIGLPHLGKVIPVADDPVVSLRPGRTPEPDREVEYPAPLRHVG